MINYDNENILAELNKLRSIRAHQPSGPIYKLVEKSYAANVLSKGNELEAICSLVESHAPTFRIRTTYRYDRILQNSNNIPEQVTVLNKKHIMFNCPTSTENKIKELIDKVNEMPKEWTIVQITTAFSDDFNSMLSSDTTAPLHISVFNCGQRELPPLCIKVDAPKGIFGKIMELRKEMQDIIEKNKNLIKNHFGDTPLEQASEKLKKSYTEHRSLLNSRLKHVETQIELSWLKEWKCLLIGKFIDDEINTSIEDKINVILENDKTYKCTKKNYYILTRLVAGCQYMTSDEIKRTVQYCLPDHKELATKMILMLKTESVNTIYKNAKRFPLILILDEQLDFFCWETIGILRDHPVCRMPSLHFTYALFKEHENTIIGGFKQISCKNGKYIINPGLDLPKMEQRLKQFFQFWLPDWKGLVGVKPTSDQFSEYLNGGDIFVYNGHGSGTQFLSASKIQHMRINSVVFLFGCGSVKMQSTSPQIEMVDTFSNYLIACSPCVVGMLWEVTDFDTDILSTDLIARWIPSNAKTHWTQIDKKLWNCGEITCVKTTKTTGKRDKNNFCEPDLLRAISQARKAPLHQITKCAIVARGLPVKLCDTIL